MDIVLKRCVENARKKLPDLHIDILDKVIASIADNPDLGAEKKGDLAGLRVYKFKISNQEKLLGYRVSPTHITFVSFGGHENFYRDLKR